MSFYLVMDLVSSSVVCLNNNKPRILKNPLFILDILFRQITTFIKVLVAFVFGLQTLQLIEFTKIYQLKVLKPKNKDHMNFYECCDLMGKCI